MKESYVNQTGTNVTSGLLLVLKTVFMQTTQQTNKKKFPQKASQAFGFGRMDNGVTDGTLPSNNL